MSTTPPEGPPDEGVEPEHAEDEVGQNHTETLARREQTHEQYMARAEAKEEDRAAQALETHKNKALTRQQRARLAIVILITLVWLGQTGLVTVYAVLDPKILTDIEKFIGLIAVTGGVISLLIIKLWPENE